MFFMNSLLEYYIINSLYSLCLFVALVFMMNINIVKSLKKNNNHLKVIQKLKLKLYSLKNMIMFNI
jgi:hypothetical protein